VGEEQNDLQRVCRPEQDDERLHQEHLFEVYHLLSEEQRPLLSEELRY